MPALVLVWAPVTIPAVAAKAVVINYWTKNFNKKPNLAY